MNELHATDVLLALLFAAIGGGLGWLVTGFLRRSIGGLLASVIITASSTTAGAIIGSVRGMLFPAHEHVATIVIIVVTGIVATAAAVVAAQRISADSKVLQKAIMDVGAGRVPDAGDRQLSAELERAHRELQATANALAEGRRREQQLEASRRQLVSWISHDLRTPLAGLRAMTEALEDGVVDDPTVYYKRMHEAVERLSKMVNDLFDVSRIQAGVVSGDNDRERLLLSDVVADAVAALEQLATKSGVVLKGEIYARPPVIGNNDELNRALTNLMANAIRHTAQGSTVAVSLAIVNGQAEVDVYDVCGGISAAHLERLFEVGYRVSEARKAEAGPNPAGAGLGLSITKGVIEAHGGTVDVKNYGRGCVFRVRLPLASAGRQHHADAGIGH